MTRPVLRHLRAPLVHRAVRSAVRGLYGPAGPVVAVVSSRVDERWPRLPAGRRLLYVIDDLVAGAELLGLPRDRLIRAEAAALAGADAVAVVSPGLRDRYRRAGHAPVLVPNGCAPEVHAAVDDAPPPDGVPLTGLVAGFVGHINDRLDLTLLEAVAGAGCSLLIVGPLAHGYRAAARFRELAARPNVHWAGPRRYEGPAVLPAAHRRRADAVRGQRVQPGQLPAQDSGGPGRRPRGGGHGCPRTRGWTPT